MINLSKYREDKGLRQKDIVEKLKVDQARVSRYENGKEVSEFMTALILENYPDAIDYLEKPIPDETEKPNKNITHIPHSAEAGFIGGYSQQILNDEAEAWQLPGFKGDGLSFVVSGNSMMDTLRPGEIVVTSKESIRSLNEIMDNFVYVIETHDNIIIKRIRKHEQPGKLWLISDNEDYKPIEINVSDIRRIFKARRHVSFNLSHKVKYSD